MGLEQRGGASIATPEIQQEPSTVRKVIDAVIKQSPIDVLKVAQEVSGKNVCGFESWDGAVHAAKRGDVDLTAALLKITPDHDGLTGDLKAAMLMEAFERQAEIQEECGPVLKREAQQSRRMVDVIGRMDY